MTHARLRRCFEGAIPAVIATATADGTPNVTYLSRVRLVDDDRVALSNQFLSKTARNLVENPRASLIVTDPDTFDEYRLSVVYERTERQGRVFEQLREDVDAVAALSGMQDVFVLRSADIYRVVHTEMLANPHPALDGTAGSGPARPGVVGTAGLAELSGRLGRCPDLDTLVTATIDGLADLLGYEHILLLLLDETGSQLYTIASHGYPDEGVGSEVTVGDGLIGMAAARCVPMRVGNLGQMSKYGRTLLRSFDHAGVGPGREIPVPVLGDAESRVAVPAMARGRLVGVLVVESPRPVAFDADDEAALTVVASLLANAIAVEQAFAAEVPDGADATFGLAAPDPAIDSAALVRFFAVDGSTFLDGDYLIKGVAGRILWSLLTEHQATGRTDFTNKEIRLDPTLELPEFRDNLESRLILLKRRLDERAAPVRLEKTGRGRFGLVVDCALRLESIGTPGT